MPDQALPHGAWPDAPVPHSVPLMPGADARDADLQDLLARAEYLARGPVPVFARSGRSVRSRRRAGHRPGAARAVRLLAIIAVTSIALLWATFAMAKSVFGASQPRFAAGPLVVPAPAQADSLPAPDGPISDPAEKHVLTAVRYRFAAALAGHAAGAARPAAIYGKPGHVDPATGKTAWIMYLGLGSKQELGAPAATITGVMMSLLRPYSSAGSWPVPAGPRGGSAQCTTVMLAATQLSVCGWATKRTVAVLVSPASAADWTELAALMIKMRYDLEQAGGPRPG